MDYRDAFLVARPNRERQLVDLYIFFRLDGENMQLYERVYRGELCTTGAEWFGLQGEARGFYPNPARHPGADHSPTVFRCSFRGQCSNSSVFGPILEFCVYTKDGLWDRWEFIWAYYPASWRSLDS